MLSDLDHTINELKLRISDDPDLFLVTLLDRLLVIRDNQQTILVDRAYNEAKQVPEGGFRGYGVS